MDVLLVPGEHCHTGAKLIQFLKVVFYCIIKLLTLWCPLNRGVKNSTFRSTFRYEYHCKIEAKI